MRAKAIIITLTAAVWLLTLPAPAAAQVPATLKFDSVFFGDNAEFFNRFRSGETILGWNQRLYWDLELSDRATLRLGAYALERLGSDTSFDRGLPIVSLTLGTPRHRFILGTLPTGERRAVGPDKTTPHNLLPPLAVETLWFTRAYESGIAWQIDTPRLTHDLWFNYQLGNTAAHRELFDAGLVDRIHVKGPLSLGLQAHIVHHGGQQFGAGPVADSLAYGPGLILEGRPSERLESASVEVYGLRAVDRPDRAQPGLTVKGGAFFMRLAARRGPWRGHASVWRAGDFIHEDGDRNYLSRDTAGTLFQGTRDYGEMGLARVFAPAPSVSFEASARLHRVESDIDYSYRLLATIELTLWRFTIRNP